MQPRLVRGASRWRVLAAIVSLLAARFSAALPAAPADAELIANGGFEQADAKGVPARWLTGRVSDATGAWSDDAPYSGNHCLRLARTTGGAAEVLSWRQQVDWTPGALYRLRFWTRAEGMGGTTAAVCIAGHGEEGPAWLLRRLTLESSRQWRPIEILVRAQQGFNALSRADLELRMYPWRSDEQIVQNLWVDDVSFRPVRPGETASTGVGPWLLIPTQPRFRYADVEFALGDGVSAVERTVEAFRDGAKLERVAYLDQLRSPAQFAYSARTRRIYALDAGASGSWEIRFVPQVAATVSLGLAEPSAGGVLRAGSAKLQRVPLEFAAGGVTRVNWPVTQGLPLPRGAVADAGEIRVLDPAGREVPAQVRATSFWEDDSLRWVLLDIPVTIAAGATSVYTVECGAGVMRASVGSPLAARETEREIHVDTGPMRFMVSRDHFRLFESLQVGSVTPLAGPPTLHVTEADGRTFTTHARPPYYVGLEEVGPMHAVIVATGWHADERGERFLTYTTRIHAYRGQRFVRVFHTITNRHEQNVTGVYRHAEGFPEDGGRGDREKKLPQRNVADAAVFLPLAGATTWRIEHPSGQYDGRVAEAPVKHRQAAREAGMLQASAGARETGRVAGRVSVAGDRGIVTAAVYRYADLFPKELRISSAGLALGLVPFSAAVPHGLLKGTARTTEMMFAFTESGSDEGAALARAFLEPLVGTNPAWYCASRGFLNDELTPANPVTSGAYDRIMASFVDSACRPYGPGVDDCGLMNFGDWPYTGRGVWVNAEYDGDLGLYIHFARTGDGAAFWRGVDASRHFLDSDTGWYTGDFRTHGANFPHNVAHFAPSGPGGHTYTVGLIHYFLLTGDRRALEATRMNADACHRVLAPAVAPATSRFEGADTVAVPRGHLAPGGAGINSRNCSDPARYSLHAYQATGEPRFLETALAIAESLVHQWPEAWRGDDDSYIHYRWPLVLAYLHDMTGGEHFRRTLLDCAEWTLKEPYRRYGEYRVAQSYGRGPQLPDRTNNTRLLFQTIEGYRLTGERRYLDWMLNMYDAQIEAHRHGPLDTFRDGKSLGKYADNLARALALIAPHRLAMVEPSPARFEITSPGSAEWIVNVANRSDARLDCTLEVGPLPAGVEMQREHAFQLQVGQEVRLELPVRFAPALPAGRTTIPYVVRSRGGGREGERHGFFAIHALWPRVETPPRLLVHASLDDASRPTAARVMEAPLIESPALVPGRAGRAFGAATEAWSLNLGANIRAEEGTFSIWVRLEDATSKEHGLLRVRGHGYPFIGIFTDWLMVSGQSLRFHLGQDADGNPVRRWRHVALTWTRDQVAYWVDGAILATQLRRSLEIPTGELWALPQGVAGFDDLRVFSIALPPEEIRELAGAVSDNGKTR